jgi:exopolysaccharide biosynthesis protein
MIRKKRSSWLALVTLSLVALLGLSGCSDLFSLITTTTTSTTTSTTTTTTITEVKYYSFTDYSYTDADKSGSVLADGVTISKYDLDKVSETKPNRLYVLDVNPASNDDVTLRVGRPSGYVRGLDTVTNMASYIDANTDLTVLGGVNADFFDIISGGPVGFTMSEGRWLTTGEFTTEGTYVGTPSATTYTCHKGWVFGIKDDGSAVIGQPTVAMTFDSYTGATKDHDDTTISILNQLRSDATTSTSQPNNAWRARADNTVVLYTPDYYTSTKTASGGVEVTFGTADTVKSNGTISGTVTAVSTAGDAALSAGTMVLSGYGDGATALSDLAVGDTISISVAVDADWADVVECVGGGRPDGGPVLVQDGALVNADYSVYEEYSSGWYNNNPRTAVGVRADGSYFFFVVDGRQTGTSNGATIDELAQFALDLGAETAINFDGGRSSTMIHGTGVDGTYTLYNVPSSMPTVGTQRNDGNGIFVVAK